MTGDRTADTTAGGTRVRRVVWVPTWYPTPSLPLNGIFHQEQAALLARKAPEVDVHVFAGERGPELSGRAPILALGDLAGHLRRTRYEAERVTDNLTVHRFKTLTWTPRVGHGGLNVEARAMLRAARAIERERGPIDLIHPHVTWPGGYLALSLARGLGVPCVLGEHMSPFPLPDLLEPDGSMKPAPLAVVRSVDRVTGVSRAHASSIEAKAGVQAAVMPNFIDEDAFRVREPGERDPDAPARFLSVGHLSEQKGFDVLLRAFAAYKGRGGAARLAIVGDGRLRDDLRALADELRVGGAVDWLGAPPRKSMPEIFRSADAFVLASRHESFGVVAVESMASGVPVVATRCGGPEETVCDACGIIVEVGDVDGLSSAMDDVLARDWDRKAVRRHFVDNYSAAACVRRLLTLYDDVVDSYG